MKIISIGPSCCVAELLKNNNGRSETYMFDWTRSNIDIICDIIENGLDWHIQNNIDNINMPFIQDQMKNNTYTMIPKYHKHFFKCLFYPHHNYKVDREKIIRMAQRFFDILDTEDELCFLHVSHKDVCGESIDRFYNLIKTRKKHFKIIICVGKKRSKDNTINIKTKENHIFIQCDSPDDFIDNHMVGKYYENLYKSIIDVL